MPRPRTPIGSHGTVHTLEVQPGVWRARTLYRGPDGKRRQVERIRPGRSSAAAVRAVKEAVVAASAGGGDSITPSTRMSVLAEVYLQSKREAGRAARTLDAYESVVRSIVVPRLGDLTVAEATPSRLQKFITAIGAENGPGAAKTSRSVLSGMFALAVRDDALRASPVAVLESAKKMTSRASVALPLDQVSRFRETISRDVELQRLDLADLLLFMLYTGARIGEALAMRWAHVDLRERRITIAATVSRARGQGLLLQEHGKTHASTRTITIAVDLVQMLERRDASGEFVFPSMLGKLRDPSNTEADWRANRDRLGYAGMTPHALRKTVATALDLAGLSARAIAEYLGHKRPSMTQDVYMSRNTGSAQAAGELNRMFGVSSESPALEAATSP